MVLGITPETLIFDKLHRVRQPCNQLELSTRGVIAAPLTHHHDGRTNMQCDGGLIEV